MFDVTFHPYGSAGEMEEEMENPEILDLPEKQKHQLRHRELFLSRQLESLPATHIRYRHTRTHSQPQKHTYFYLLKSIESFRLFIYTNREVMHELVIEIKLDCTGYIH